MPVTGAAYPVGPYPQELPPQGLQGEAQGRWQVLPHGLQQLNRPSQQQQPADIRDATAANDSNTRFMGRSFLSRGEIETEARDEKWIQDRLQ